MAELDAFGKAVSGFTLDTPQVNIDGSAVVKMHNSQYRPQLKLSPAERSQLITGLQAKPLTFDGYSPTNMPIAYYSSTAWPNVMVPEFPKVLPNSQAICSYIHGGTGCQPMWSDGKWDHPAYFVSESDPIVELTGIIYGATGLNGQKLRCPTQAIPAPGSDHHMALIMPNGQEVGLWNVTREGSKIKALGAGVGDWTTGNGTAGATASNFCNQAGVIRAEELIAGYINHALFMPVTNTKGIVSPATNTDGTSTDPNAPAMGQRVYLEYTNADLQNMIGLFPKWKFAIVRALTYYGAYVGDTGTGGGFAFKFWGQQSYTQYGLPNPYEKLLKEEKLDYFDINAGIDWSKLRAIA